jgi:RsmE family RNA methyltransferase
MNLVLLSQQDFINENQVQINDRRLDHINSVHQANKGDQLSVGLINGNIGTGLIIEISHTQLLMEVSLTKSPPSPLPLTLVVALPRPKMLKRILQTCATMGVKKIIFINSYRVEKSFWSTPLLSEKSIREQFILGLEQGKDTLIPEVMLEKRFKPFVEDRLPAICDNTLALVAHPNSDKACPSNINQQTTLIIGPEGGFIPYEIDLLIKAGITPVHIGQRILRVETAVTALLARLFT